MNRTLVSLLATLCIVIAVCGAALNSASESIENVETISGSIQSKQLEKIEVLNELQGIDNPEK